MSAPPKVGIFDLTGCNGDCMQIVNCEDELLDIVGVLDIQNFRLARGTDCELLKTGKFRSKGPFDISFIEGTITTEEEIEIVKHIREVSQYVVAMGTCACDGGLPSMLNVPEIVRDPDERRAMYFPEWKSSKIMVSVKPRGLDEVIDIDTKIQGCPITKKEFLSVTKSLLLGKVPDEYHNKPVCIECKLAGVPCIYTQSDVWIKRQFGVDDPDAKLIDYFPELCLGPISQAGCDALCPKLGRGCQGCRGNCDGADIAPMKLLLRNNGMEEDEITRLLTKFGSIPDEEEEE